MLTDDETAGITHFFRSGDGRLSDSPPAGDGDVPNAGGTASFIGWDSSPLPVGVILDDIGAE